MTLTLASDGDLVQHSHYQPYGDAANIQPSRVQPYGFSGKERDDSGLMYFEARYYDPVSGRFISPDPLFAEQMDKCLGSVIECNLYQYTGNNPVNYTDPSGKYIQFIGGRALSKKVLGKAGKAFRNYKKAKRFSNLAQKAKFLAYQAEIGSSYRELYYSDRKKSTGDVFNALAVELNTGKPVDIGRNPESDTFHRDKGVGSYNRFMNIKLEVYKDPLLTNKQKKILHKAIMPAALTLRSLIKLYDSNPINRSSGATFNSTIKRQYNNPNAFNLNGLRGQEKRVRDAKKKYK